VRPARRGRGPRLSAMATTNSTFASFLKVSPEQTLTSNYRSQAIPTILVANSLCSDLLTMP
jgi:hypothetical protein